MQDFLFLCTHKPINSNKLILNLTLCLYHICANKAVLVVPSNTICPTQYALHNLRSSRTFGAFILFVCLKSISNIHIVKYHYDMDTYF